MNDTSDIDYFKLKFRSLLPQEPIPKNFESNGKGFLHLQGAFEPKSKKDGINKNNKKKKEKKADKKQQDIATNDTAPPALPQNNNDNNDESFWTIESLEQVLFQVFSNNTDSIQLPFVAEKVMVLDAHSFSKLRLVYSSPQQAWHVFVALRQFKLSPNDLLSKIVTLPSSNSDHLLQFGNHACQVTCITTDPLPDTSSCWNRSNPPKFLQAKQGDTQTTRFVYITNLIPTIPQNNQQEQKEQSTLNIPEYWKSTMHVTETIRHTLNQYDSSNLGIEVFVSHKQQKKQQVHACHVGMRSSQDAQTLVQSLQGKVISWKYPFFHDNNNQNNNNDNNNFSSGILYLDYATISQRSNRQQENVKGEASRPECTSLTKHVTVPGLYVITDFITQQQEETLLAILNGPHTPWAPLQTNFSQTGTVKRKVQHYGYVFDYQTANVLRDRTIPNVSDCPPMPCKQQQQQQHIPNKQQLYSEWNVLAETIQQTREYTFPNGQQYPNINQLTVNQYKPGEGIGSHTDTLSAFGDGLLSISLGSDIVMEFTNKNGSLRKLVYLPRRSIVAMTGPARFEWEHMIVSRKTDTHNGTVLTRGTRISLTLRTAIQENSNGDNTIPMPLIESNQFPPKWGQTQQTNEESNATNCSTTNSSLYTPDTEKNHVHAVYDAIATQWHHTRGKRGVLWPGATEFITTQFPPPSIIADVGCGDGKYFPPIWQGGNYVIGTDISRPLLVESIQEHKHALTENRQVSVQYQHLQQRPAVAVADALLLPIRSNSCDGALCIAVMHHLSTVERRIRCIQELIRIVKPMGGKIYIQAWAMEQKDNTKATATIKRRFAASDVFVPFNAQPKYLMETKAMNDNNNDNNTNNQQQQAKSTASASASAAGEDDVAPVSRTKSVAESVANSYQGADYDEQKGLVVFQRYCHLYQQGELDGLVQDAIESLSDSCTIKVLESGYENGNHYVILEK